MTKLSQRITGKIKKEHIEQEPRWKFIVRHSAFWTLFIIAALLGAAAFSVILFVIFEIDMEIIEYGRFSKLHYFMTVLPLFWIIFFGLFFGLALYGVKHTKKGYRFAVWKLVLANIIGSILIGGTVYGFGGAEHFEQMFHGKVPGYKGLDEQQMKIWSEPENGLLGGKIMELTDEKIILLEDFSNTQWEISIPEIPAEHQRLFQDIESGKLKGKKIKVIGEQTGENTFEAERIMAWRRKQPPFRRSNKSERPEEHLMKMMELRQAMEEGDMETVKRLQEELRPPPPRKKRSPRNDHQNGIQDSGENISRTFSTQDFGVIVEAHPTHETIKNPWHIYQEIDGEKYDIVPLSSHWNEPVIKVNEDIVHVTFGHGDMCSVSKSDYIYSLSKKILLKQIHTGTDKEAIVYMGNDEYTFEAVVDEQNDIVSDIMLNGSSTGLLGEPFQMTLDHQSNVCAKTAFVSSTDEMVSMLKLSIPNLIGDEDKSVEWQIDIDKLPNVVIVNE